MIMFCNHCRRLVDYKNSSDLLDGHKCPERAAAVRAERTTSPREVGGSAGDEVFSEYDLERESLDVAEPPKSPGEQEVAEVIELRTPRCTLCHGRPKLRWDESEPLVCSGCGAGIKETVSR